VFSIVSDPRLHKEDPITAEIELREPLETAVEDDCEEIKASCVL
jgi:hypothetical protein